MPNNITKDIPPPAKNSGGRPLKYPQLADLQVGESFAVKDEMLLVSGIIYSYGKRHDRAFTCRREKGGKVRIWRTE